MIEMILEEISFGLPQAPQLWRTLKGPTLSKDQNTQCATICRAVVEGRMPRVEAVNRICDLAASWGMPIEDERIHEYASA